MQRIEGRLADIESQLATLIDLMERKEIGEVDVRDGSSFSRNARNDTDDDSDDALFAASNFDSPPRVRSESWQTYMDDINAPFSPTLTKLANQLELQTPAKHGGVRKRLEHAFWDD